MSTQNISTEHGTAFFKKNENICIKFSIDGKIIEFNKTALEFFDTNASYFLGKSILSVFTKDAQQKATTLYNEWLNENILDMKHIELCNNSGKRKEVYWSVIPSQEKDIFISFFRSSTNVANKDLKLKRIESMANIGTWDIWHDTSSFECSDETFRIFGKDPETCEPNPRCFWNLIHEPDRKKLRKQFDASINKGLTYFYAKYRIVHGLSGKLKWVYNKFYHNYNSNGDLISTSGIIQDIDTSEEQKLYYERFYQVIKYATIPAVLTDSNGKILFVNHAVENLYEHKTSELVGKTPSVYNSGRKAYFNYWGFTDEEYEQYFSSMWKDLKNQDKGFWEGEVLNKTGTGELLLVYLYIFAIRDEHKEIVSYVGANINISKHRKEEESARIETYRAIASIAEYRDNETGKHMARIGEYCYILSSMLGLSHKFCNDIRIFSPLHDIGKVGIPDNVLLAPRKLSTEEFEKIKTHTKIGYEILKDRPFMEMAADIAYSHQEKFDGTGYPRGLSGKDIPLSARICTVVDVYDALRSRRPYKEPYSEEKSISIIEEGKGTHFDPEIVDAFLKYRSEMNEIFETLIDD
ncbi:MAG: PAS domain S-box protein [Spirochaetales bacterium]|nr:PAS domain S-box protein [Spirochaetales bacterium]